MLTSDHMEILDDRYGSTSLREHFGYQPGWGLPGSEDRTAIAGLMGAAR